MPRTDDPLRAAFAPGSFRAHGHALVDLLADHLARAAQGDGMPVLPRGSPDELLARWPGDFPREPSADAVEALVSLAARTVADSNHLHHARYVGHQVTSPLPLAALCELVSGLLNNGMAVYEMGPAATAMERRVVLWLAGQLGFGGSADGILTSGGSAANLTALLAARQARAGFDAWRDGAHAGPPLAVLASDQAHYSVRRAVQVMGLGADGVVTVPTDAGFRLRADALGGALDAATRAGRRVFAVVASAGSTATGSFDPLPAIADFCERRGLWLHVDGAHGASAALSPRTRTLLAGIERADSVVWDPHKMMLMPALVSAVLFRDGRDSYRAFEQEASYLFRGETQGGEWWNVGLRTLECTKRMLGFPLYASLSLLGTRPFGDYVESRFALAARFGEMLEAAPDFELAVAPQCNIVCFRHTPRGVADLDALQTAVRARILHDGSFYLVQTRLPAGVFLRTTLIQPFTGEADLAALLGAVRRAATGV